ncbi:MAG: hypothetical protein JETCAE03_36040 [Ignavibacteriaceae bacterium]|jgi:hypothetical protein|nr:MAG: hypothetical protein JETCAE03_36040 [Ignavibacteriaceae bacterium]
MENLKCEYCENEYDGSYGTGRFCNSKCARGYATKFKRKEINEKVSQKLLNKTYLERIIKSCIVCNSSFESIKKYNIKTCGRQQCKNQSRSITQKNISKNVGDKNPMYGKSPSHTKRYEFFSKKNNCKIICKSTYELRALNLLENDKEIIKYEYEPFHIPYDKKHSTIPDFLITYKNSIKLIEVKPTSHLKLWNNDIKINAMKQYCKKHNFLFDIWTEKELQL